MIKKFFILCGFLIAYAPANEVNFTHKDLQFKSLSSQTCDVAQKIISDFNENQKTLFAHNGIIIGDIIPTHLKRQENKNAWHMQLVYRADGCLGVLAYGKMPTNYPNAEHADLHQEFRQITTNLNPMATCVWALKNDLVEEDQGTIYSSMALYAKYLKDTQHPLPLTECIPDHLFVLTAVEDTFTQGLLAKSEFSILQSQAWSLFYDKPRTAAFIEL